MANITANDVKVLRERTGAGMMDCKKALVACEGDMEAAIDWLRKKGLAAASKKSGRVTAEGVVAVYSCGKRATLLELNAETDFVARNEMFQNYARTLAKIACEGNLDIDALKATMYPDSERNVADELVHLISIIGENLSIRRVEHLEVESGVVATYIHSKLAENLGKIGVLVAISGSCECPSIEGLGKQIAMHVAAANPKYLAIENISTEDLERERAVVTEMAKASGKPDNVVEKMVIGRLNKFYEEIVLLEQTFVIDGETKIKDVVKAAGNECGCELQLSGFKKFVLGEGIEKATVDFASEVAAQLG